ncbi:hypothetical protein DUI87_15351 [Hirundo rustica rustica]|uniref:Uncharacterized protein n=1 Tax=Hirundo rustica rustica TaxID=333673 RepID=A0A3M0K9Z6_HIRRU|nr:hypothetical protein DUI87_15351 [Hirundo rustica rustica]
MLAQQICAGIAGLGTETRASWLTAHGTDHWELHTDPIGLGESLEVLKIFILPRANSSLLGGGGENYRLAAVCPFDVKQNLWDDMFVTSMVVFGHMGSDLSWWLDLKIWAKPCFGPEHQVDGLDFVRERQVDGLNFVREHQVDGLDLGREHQVDGLNFVREHQVDGLNLGREHQVDGLNFVREHQVDGLNFVREQQVDGLNFVREHQVDGLNFVREHQVHGLDFGLEHQVEGLDFGREHQMDVLDFGPEHQVEGLDELCRSEEGRTDVYPSCGICWNSLPAGLCQGLLHGASFLCPVFVIP